MKLLQSLLFLYFITLFTLNIYAQCTTQVSHLLGTQMVGCTNVTVDTAGSTDVPTTYCPTGSGEPYRAASSSKVGSYTFTFNPPIDSATLNFSGLFNRVLRNEIRLTVNGTPYPVPSVGTLDPFCSEVLATLTAQGNITGRPGSLISAGWNGTTIPGPISTLTVKDTVTNGTSSQATFYLFICDNGSFDADVLPDDSLVCQNDSIILDATIPNATYLWQDGSTDSTFTVKQAGLYRVAITNSCGTVVDSTLVTIDSFPVVNLGEDTTICAGDTILLTANTLPGLTYEWQDGSTNSFYTVTEPGNYNVTVTNECGIINDAIQITLPNLMSVDIGEDTTICIEDSLILDATAPNATYLWQDGSTNSTFTVKQAGLYRVAITTSCGTVMDSIQVGIDSFPVVDLGEDTTICGSSSLILVATYPNATYLWQDNSTDETFTVTDAGEYHVAVTNNCGTTRDSIQVEKDSLPAVTLIEDTTICAGDTIILTANTISGVTYQWQDNSTDSFYVVTEPGNYNVTVTNNCGMDNDAIQITLPNLMSVDVGDDTTICKEDSIILEVTAPGATYLWQDGSTNSTFTVKQAGLYKVAISTSCGTIMDSIQVGIDSFPVVDLGEDTTICAGDTIILTAKTISGVTYQWQDNSTDSFYVVTEPGNYNVTVTNNCGTDNDAIQFTQPNLMSVDVGNDTTVCEGNTIILDASTPNATYLWQDNSTNPTFTVTQAGTYSVVVNNDCGTTEDSINITSISCDCNTFLPNAFTPDGDGVNDQFIASSFCTFTKYNLIIMDRWGQQVFQSDNITDRWDGTYKGEKVNTGIYIYLLTSSVNNKPLQIMNGSITLNY